MSVQEQQQPPQQQQQQQKTATTSDATTFNKSQLASGASIIHLLLQHLFKRRSNIHRCNAVGRLALSSQPSIITCAHIDANIYQLGPRWDG